MPLSQEALAAEAVRFHKAWALTWAWLGQDLPPEDALGTNYANWSIGRLRDQVQCLQSDYLAAVKHIVDFPNKNKALLCSRWFAQQFDEWATQGFGLHKLAYAFEFERDVGKLKARETVEVPPYGELLLQGFHGVAVRHPEYMLARDLTLAYSLYMDSEQHLLSTAKLATLPEWCRYASENQFTLGRMTIICCFNLVESFISGLARAHVMANPRLPDETRAKLLDNRKELAKRITSVPQLITGRRCPLEHNKEPLSVLLGAAKQYRDSFVHCEPGPMPSAAGYVKEVVFNDITQSAVESVVSSTLDIITGIWEFVHGVPGPRWLPRRGDRGLIGKPCLRLAATTELPTAQSN